MKGNPVFIDANIPMYANGAAHPLRAPCLVVLSRLANRDLVGVTSVEVIQEIVHRYTSTNRRREGRDLANDFMIVMTVMLPVAVDDVRLMLSYVDQYPELPARDLLHVAVMVNNGISEIVSADAHFDQVPLIKRIDPRSMSVH